MVLELVQELSFDLGVVTMDFKGETAPYFGEWTVAMGGQALCGKVFPAGTFEEGELSHNTQCAFCILPWAA